MSKLEEVYKEFKPLFESDNPPSGLMRSFVKKFIFPLYFSFNERIRKCEAQYEVYKNKSCPQPSRRVVHEIPEGYMLAEEFCKNYYGSVGFISNTVKADGDLREFRKKIGRLLYVHGEGVHNFFDSQEGRQRYPRMVSKVDRYKEQLNERQRQGKADSQVTAFL